MTRLHLEIEVRLNTNVWFARVPTEANIADIPSRFEQHPFLQKSLEVSSDSLACLESVKKDIKSVRSCSETKGEGSKQAFPHVKRSVACHEAAHGGQITVKLFNKNRAV